MSDARTLTTPLLALLLLAAAGCATAPRDRSAAARADAVAAVPADTADIGVRLAGMDALDAEARADLRRRAEDAAADWRRFEAVAEAKTERLTRSWFYRAMPDQSRDRIGVGLGNAVVDLRRATAIDPSFAEAWAAEGRLLLAAGSPAAAHRALENARLAAAAAARHGENLPADLARRVDADLAWAAYDEALWTEGLAAADRGLARTPGDQELLLVRGLLLAGAGRGEEALAAAAQLPPLRYRMITFTFGGLRRQQSAYANNWIRAMVWLRRGDPQMALHALGEPDLYAYRPRLPFAARYWRDAGLVAELARDDRAAVWYSLGHLARPYGGFLPVTPQNVAPQVLELPDPELPVFTSFGRVGYAGGSPLSYVGLQLNVMATGLNARTRLAAAGRALDMLGILERRRIAPAFVHAARGRIRYVNDDFAAAAVDLARARELLAAEDRVDPVTSMMLGLIALEDGRDREAAALLAETAAADPGRASAWRMLGVARARLGDRAGALAAMDRAVALEPGSVAAWYNRGLLRLQHRGYAGAAADLTAAYRLDPENREVQRLLQMAVAGARAAGEPVPDAATAPPPTAAPADSLVLAMQRQLDALFTLPDSLRVSPAETAARIVVLEHRYAAGGDPAARRDLALAYLDAGRHRDAQRLLQGGWGVDLGPDEELMLLHADRHLGEQRRAEELTRSLLEGEAAEGNAPAWGLALLMARDRDLLGDPSRVDAIFLKYCAGTKARAYGFPPLDQLTDWMRDGFAASRAARSHPDPDVVTGYPDSPWLRAVKASARGGVQGPPPAKGSTK